MSISITNTKIYGLQDAILRSGYPKQVGTPSLKYTCTSKDITRASKLASVPTGTGHDNFLKGVIVQFDLHYPEYFSTQLQRYSWIDIISSQSKMHCITSRLLTKEDFTEDTEESSIELINNYIEQYKVSEDSVVKKNIFKKIISNLPCGYMKWMGISTNYLQLKTIYFQRKVHKIEEWDIFCNWVEQLPQANKLIINKK